MTSYGFKKDVARGVGTASGWTMAFALFFLFVVPFFAMYYLVKGIIALVAYLNTPRGRWVMAMTWWHVRHPRQAWAWCWAKYRYRIALMKR